MNLKPRQKLIIPTKQKVTVHNEAAPAFKVWQRCRPKVADINLQRLDKFYRPALRLIQDDEINYYFINDFYRVDQILRLEKQLNHPCLIIPEHTPDILRLAWAEVLKLCRLAYIQHPEIYAALKRSAPQRLLCELMELPALTIEGYCKFAAITQSHYEYQQFKVTKEEDIIGLPNSMAWLDEVS